jgi:molecular chaperone GrpE
MAKKSQQNPQEKKVKGELEELQRQLAEVQEKEKRALADYQNLVRRNQQERTKLVQLANRDLIEALLQPLEHLELAVTQTKDSGVKMVLEQLKQTLTAFGLEEIEVEGQEFDVETMEAVENDGRGNKVSKVLRKGYRFNGVVIQHAKVVLE